MYIYMYIYIYINIHKYVNINEFIINNDTHVRRPCRGVPEASQEGQLEEELVFVIEGWDRRLDVSREGLCRKKTASFKKQKGDLMGISWGFIRFIRFISKIHKI